MLTNTYKCLSRQVHERGNYMLLPLRYEDIFLIKQWRNEQIDVLRQKKELTDEDQENYYRNVIYPLFTQEKPTQILFSLFKDKKFIGYGGLVYVNWEDKRGEISFLVDTTRAKDKDIYKEDFLAYKELIKEVAFETLGFNRLFTETYAIRTFHISLLELSGFVLEGRMKEHVIINGQFVDSLIHGFLKSYYYAKK